MAAPTILPFGDAAVLVELGTTTGILEARRARALARRINALRLTDPRLGAPVAAAASVLVPFDPRTATPAELSAILGPLFAERPDSTPDAPDDGPGRREPREHLLRVRYGGENGPDLEAVAVELGLTAADVIGLHSAAPYEVLFLGFAPGFAYLGELPAALVLPRLPTPRTAVPAGSVAIADAMTAVYPRRSPGGWRLLGRTEVVLFDPHTEPPSRLRPGDRVRFEPA